MENAYPLLPFPGRPAPACNHVTLRRGHVPWVYMSPCLLAGFPEVQSPGCSSPTPFLRAGFEASNLGGQGHMSRLASARCKSSGSLRLRVCPLKHVPLPLPLGPPLQPSYLPHGFLTSTAPLTTHLSPPFSQLALTVKEQTNHLLLGVQL